MIVIVEGIDRVGKTTLCEKLKERGFILLKDSLDYFLDEKRETMAACSAAKIDTTFRFLEQMGEQGKDVVVDRLHLTEIVYGKCDRGGKSWDGAILEMEKMLFEKLGPDALLVLVEPTDISEANERAKQDLTKHDKVFKSLYSMSNLLKMRTSFPNLDEATELIMKWRNSCSRYDFYLASPFFNLEQIEREERIKKTLRDMGYKVFSPKEFSHLTKDASLDDQLFTFSENCKAIREATAVFAITDGKDMGTIWEAGYAYGIKKPIIYYAETLGDNPFNLMLAQSGNVALTAFSQLEKETIDKVLNNPVKKVSFGGFIE